MGDVEDGNVFSVSTIDDCSGDGDNMYDCDKSVVFVVAVVQASA